MVIYARRKSAGKLLANGTGMCRSHERKKKASEPARAPR